MPEEWIYLYGYKLYDLDSIITVVVLLLDLKAVVGQSKLFGCANTKVCGLVKIVSRPLTP